VKRIFVFVQDGCPACEEFLPVLSQVSEAHRSRGGQIFTVNIGKQRGATLAQTLQIEATPTMVIVDDADKPIHTVVGAVPPAQIISTLHRAEH